MSLINQMLKDLEYRGAMSNNSLKINHATMSEKTSKTSAFTLLIIVVLVLVLMMGGVLYFWLQATPKLNLSTNVAAMLSHTISENVLPSHVKNTAQADATENNTKREAPLIVLAQAPMTVKPAVIATSHAMLAKAVSAFETELRYSLAENQVQLEKPFIKHQKHQALTPSTTQENSDKSMPDPPATTSALSRIPESSNAQVEKLPRHTLARLSTQLGGDNVAASHAEKKIRPDQKSGNDYRQALLNLQQGRVSEAQANLTQALEANPANQEARLTLAGLLLESKRMNEAKALLAAGLTITPEQNEFRIALARLQVESGNQTAALNTLELGLAHAKDNANYQNFLATLLQRSGRHEEAISHYMTAVSLGSSSASTLIGLGISLQAVGQLKKAKDAFTQAQASTELTPELSNFVEQKLKHLQDVVE